MQKIFARFALCAGTIAAWHLLGGLPSAAGKNLTEVRCRVIESHASRHPAALIILFHQEDRGDQERLSALLRAHSGEQAGVQAQGKWASGTVIRLKGCFGRGLLVLPADAPTLKDGAEFLLKISNPRDPSGAFQGHHDAGSEASP